TLNSNLVPLCRPKWRSRPLADGHEIPAMRLRTVLLLGVFIAAATTACARSPEAQTARHLERGDGYFKPEQCREALSAYWKEPSNLEALALFASAARTPPEIAAAIRRLEATRADHADRAKWYLALGGLYVMQQDLPAAESGFRDAVAREPGSVEAHLVLGNFY